MLKTELLKTVPQVGQKNPYLKVCSGDFFVINDSKSNIVPVEITYNDFIIMAYTMLP